MVCLDSSSPSSSAGCTTPGASPGSFTVGTAGCEDTSFSTLVALANTLAELARDLMCASEASVNVCRAG